MRMLTLALCVIRRPVTTFEAMKADRENFRFWPIAALLALVAAARIAQIFLTHYPMAGVDPERADLTTELAFYLVPILTFAVANFGVTSVLDGETRMGESLMAILYCMVPFILSRLPLAALSHLVDRTDGTIYTLLDTAVWAWTGLLILTGIRVMNHYSLGKTILIAVLDVLAMALIWAVCLLLYALANQLWLFLDGIAREIRFCFGG